MKTTIRMGGDESEGTTIEVPEDCAVLVFTREGVQVTAPDGVFDAVTSVDEAELSILPTYLRAFAEALWAVRDYSVSNLIGDGGWDGDLPKDVLLAWAHLCKERGES
jgi:hypothetical protein